jgi:peptide/nickel transport system substrate-binding protein
MKKLLGFARIPVSIALFALLMGAPLFAAESAGPVVYRIGYPNETDGLSPISANSAYAGDLFKLIYDPLVGFGDDLAPKGKLAESWSVSDDDLVWTFHLRKGVQWSDGQPFTAADVKFTYELYQKAQLMYASQLTMIKTVDVLDDYTVKITTDQPKANMLQITAPILPKHIWESIPVKELATYPNKNPVGTGAFSLVEWKEKDSITLAANKKYFDGAPAIDQLIFILFGNKDTMVQALKTGEIDAAMDFNPNQASILENDHNIKVILADERSFTELGFNCYQDPASKGNKLLLDKRIRQAMDWALDKEKLVSFSKMGAAYPGTTIFPTSQPQYHYDIPAADLRKYDPERARKILDDAGYVDRDGDGIREDAKGNKLSFRFAVISSYDHYVKSSQLMKTMFADVGIEVKLETLDEGVLIDRLYSEKANFDLFIWGWTSAVDPSYILDIMLTSEIGNMSDCFYSNPKYDELYNKQLTSVDPTARKKIIDEMQAVIYEDVPYSIMYYNKCYEAYRTDKFTGFARVPAEKGPLFYLTLNTTGFTTIKPLGKGGAGGKTGNAALYIIVGIAAVAAVVFGIKKKSERSNKPKK